MASDKYLLKIIAGPNAGAEIALEEEELLVGIDPDCDLILSDSLVSDEHMKIRVKDDKVFVFPVAGEVYVAGEEIKEIRELKEFEFVSLGTTHFVVGKINSNWPPLNASDVPALVRQISEPELHQELSEPEEIQTDIEPTNTPSENEKNEDYPTPLLSRKMIITGAALVFVLIAGLSFSAYYFITKKQTTVEHKQQENITETTKQKVKSTLEAIGVSEHFTIEDQAGGDILVTGWVADKTKQQEVEDSLRPLSSTVKLTVWNEEALKDGVKHLIASLGSSIAMEDMNSGIIKLKGYYGNDSEWEQTKAKLMSEVPGLKLIKDEVVTGLKLQPIIDDVIAQYNLKDKIHISTEPSEIVVRGVINDKEEKNVKDMLLALNSRLGVGVPFKNQVVITETEKIFYQLDIETVVVGTDHGYIVTKSGERLFEGGMLKGGFTIAKISRDGIILKKDKQTITLNIEGK